MRARGYATRGAFVSRRPGRGRTATPNRCRPCSSYPTQARDGVQWLPRATLGPAKGNGVTHSQVLKLGEYAGGTRTIQKTKEAVEPVVAIEPAALIAHLHQPRPNVFRPRVDEDGHRARIRRIDDEAIARHDAGQIRRRGAPTGHPASTRKPVQHRECEDHEECGKHETSFDLGDS